MQKSFADCSKCKLHSCNGKVCETNSACNLNKVQILYLVDELHHWDDIKTYAESKNQKYLITSPILCKSNCPLSNDELENIAQHCKVNAINIIDKCEPNTLIAIGPYSGAVRSKYETKVQKWKDYNSFISSLNMVENIVDDLSCLTDDNHIIPEVKKIKNPKIWKPEQEPYMFIIPEKYYTDQYRLVDIQSISNQSRIIYIFRDSQNNKEYYEIPIKENDFYWYESLSTDNQIIERIDDLELKIGNYKNRCTTSKGYGGDMSITTVHSIDYFLQNKAEAHINNKNAFYFDIEVYTYQDRIFPDPSLSLYPISAFSFKMHDNSDPEHIYLLKLPGEVDPRIDKIIKSNKYPTLTVFTDEYSMIVAFLSKLRECDPDFICGWNCNSFDIPYIIGRMKKLNIPMKNLSPFGNVYADGKGKVICTGYIPMDQLKLYRDLTYTNLPSYTLDNVAKKEKVGEKTPYEGDLRTLYNKDIDTYIEYSLNDTFLLKGIEDETQHISLQDELRRLTSNTQSGASSTLGQAEGVISTSMKQQKLIARNNSHHVVKEKLPGAYVFDAKGGLYDGLLCDFDFTSLYPSIINSWNIGPDTFLAILVNDEDTFNLIYQKEKLVDKKIEVILDPIHNSVKTEMSLDEINKLISDNEAQINIAGSIFSGHHKDKSILYTVIDSLFTGRKTYKQKMLEAKESGNETQANIFNGKQMAYKILANSLYGALGNEHFRFYNINLAKSITLTGQELLKYCAVSCDDYLVKRGNIPQFQMDLDFFSKVKSLQDVLYGDTDSIFVYLTDYLKDKKIDFKNKDLVQKEIDAIQDHINNIALDPYLKAHGIRKEDSIIFLKNEFLFSKYYTLNGKKHYAAKVISQEGKDIRFIDVKGLETRRSEIPARSKLLLNGILDIILSDNIAKSDIKIQVDELVNTSKLEMLELINQRCNSMVKVVSYSKPLEQYKKLPQHIKAMLIWNCLMDEDFRYGTKGKLWPLKGIDLEKAPESVKCKFNDKFLKKFKHSDLDCICIPEDVDKLPEWFVPDVKRIISYSCDDRVSNLTEPLWKDADQMLLW